MTKKPSEYIREGISKFPQQEARGNLIDACFDMYEKLINVELVCEIPKAYDLGCSREFLADCLEAKGM